MEISTIGLKVPCYLIKVNKGFVLIDTGDSSDCAKLIKKLGDFGVKSGNLNLVLLTHGDFDHAGNAAFLQKEYGAKIAMHANDSGMVENGDQNWSRKSKPDRISFFGRIIILISSHLARAGRFKTFKPDILVKDGQNLSDYGFNAKILELPGHSKGSIGILTSEGALFCGDLLTNMIIPAPHFMIDDNADFKASMIKLQSLPIKMVYPGHGKPFSMSQFMPGSS
jgi:hydroxyacylglutathione hydrolase